MKLLNIQPAVPKIIANPVVVGLRGHTYLSTYPCIIAIGTAPITDEALRFQQLATMVYGWMPRILRIDSAHVCGAISAFVDAQAATIEDFKSVQIQDIANCLHSVVGASKLLHFVNPCVFPIWDSKIEAFRQRHNSNINSVEQYIDYVSEVNDIRNEAGFPEFFAKFSAAYNLRLSQSGINPYAITEVRAIEAAAFELSQ